MNPRHTDLLYQHEATKSGKKPGVSSINRVLNRWFAPRAAYCGGVGRGLGFGRGLGVGLGLGVALGVGVGVWSGAANA